MPFLRLVSPQPSKGRGYRRAPSTKVLFGKELTSPYHSGTYKVLAPIRTYRHSQDDSHLIRRPRVCTRGDSGRLLGSERQHFMQTPLQFQFLSACLYSLHQCALMFHKMLTLQRSLRATGVLDRGTAATQHRKHGTCFCAPLQGSRTQLLTGSSY